MPADQIQYRSGYKYQLAAPYSIRITIRPEEIITTNWLALEPSGWLHINVGYCWDGPSGPACDTKSFMRASLVHDALYQLMRLEQLPQECRKDADQIMLAICKADGMWAPRRWWCYRAVRRFAARAADPASRKEVKVAP